MSNMKPVDSLLLPVVCFDEIHCVEIGIDGRWFSYDHDHRQIKSALALKEMGAELPGGCEFVCSLVEELSTSYNANLRFNLNLHVNILDYIFERVLIRPDYTEKVYRSTYTQWMVALGLLEGLVAEFDHLKDLKVDVPIYGGAGPGGIAGIWEVTIDKILEYSHELLDQRDSCTKEQLANTEEILYFASRNAITDDAARGLTYKSPMEVYTEDTVHLLDYHVMAAVKYFLLSMVKYRDFLINEETTLEMVREIDCIMPSSSEHFPSSGKVDISGEVGQSFVHANDFYHRRLDCQLPSP